VAGEHGLGKLKRDLLAIQYPEARIAAMRDIKRRWDPNWILGRGNLFSPEDS
jgi:FAD/FMN-containing dehydrogenase